MNESKEDEILQELRRISKLLALTATRELKQQTEKIELLYNIGFQYKEIADLIGTTPGTVSVALARIKKETQTGKRKKVKPSKEVKPSDKQAAS
jgi:DNA-directed RNA polymerase specialized sigma24 family protein